MMKTQRTATGAIPINGGYAGSRAFGKLKTVGGDQNGSSPKVGYYG